MIGDSFGPIVGTKLKKLFESMKNVYIIGDLENTVNNNNANNIINEICDKYNNPFIISIDSAFSNTLTCIGKIVVGKGGIWLGQSLGREKYIIGDMNIKGIVAKNMHNMKKNIYLLQNASLGQIEHMAEIVANGIYCSIDCE